MNKKMFCILILSLSVPLLFAQTDLAHIREINGKVEVRTPGGSWTPASVGMRVDNNTDISTGFNSSALVSLGESMLTIRPLTRLSLEEIIRREESESVSLHLLAGRVRADVKPPAGSRTEFTVRSATATASVRGTGFEFDTVNLNVTEGSVSFVGSGGGPAIPVLKGETSSIDAGGSAAPPVSVLAAAASQQSLPPGLEQILPAATNISAAIPQLVEYFGTVTVNIEWE